MSFCCHILANYRGPLIVIAVGVGFMIIGSLPVAITISLGIKNSATIIGVGFIGFGLLLVVPGLIWCIVRRILSLPCCTSERLHTPEIPEQKKPTVRLAPRSYRPSGQPFPAIIEDVNSEQEDCSCILKNDDIEDASSQAALVDQQKEYSTILIENSEDCEQNSEDCEHEKCDIVR